MDKQAGKTDAPVNNPAAQAPDWRICPRGDHDNDGHAWVSEHRPGHAVYWIRQCSLCHQVDLDDLDHAIAACIAEAFGKTGYPGRYAETARIERIRQGGAFGHNGEHHGFGVADCPRTLHHHHDEFCELPTEVERTLAMTSDEAAESALQWTLAKASYIAYAPSNTEAGWDGLPYDVKERWRQSAEAVLTNVRDLVKKGGSVHQRTTLFPPTSEDSFRIAGEIKLIRGKSGAARLYIDGEYFPYGTQDGYTCHVNKRQLSGITLTIVADKVIVEDTWLDTSSSQDAPETRTT